MLVEHRIYQTVIGRFQHFVDLYRAEGLPVQIPIQGRLLGFYGTEVGPQYQAVLLWEYDSFEERLRRRAILNDDPGWRAFLARSAPLVTNITTMLLRPIPHHRT